MSDKLPCDACGAMILTDTSRRNGGLCMPCKTGTRANIDASKAYYAREKELDRTCPFRALWRDLVSRAHSGPDDLRTLSDDQKLYYSVGILSGEVENGGFHQYFHNSAGSTYRYAELGLIRIGATHSLELLRSAKRLLFGDGRVPLEQDRRWKHMRDTVGKELDLLDAQFWEDADDLGGRLEAFAIETGLVKIDR